MELVLFQAIETDMGEQVRRCDALNECGQQIVRYVDSQVAVSRIDTLLENLQERWEKLVQMMEHYSNQVITTVTRSWAKSAGNGHSYQVLILPGNDRNNQVLGLVIG